jgi:hypothetical protein
VYYLPATGFGEIKSVLALIKMLKAKNENIEWKILIQDRRHEICDLMVDYNKYIELINATEYYRLTRLIINPYGYSIYMKYCNKLIFASADAYIKPFYLNRDLNLRMIAVVKALLSVEGNDYLHLTLPHPLHYYNNLFEQYNIMKGKSVFINSNARTVKYVPKELFELIALELQKLGFETYSLIPNTNSDAVQGTVGIVATLEESLAMIQYGGALVGVRSGFIDVAADFNCIIESIYDNSFENQSYFDLKQWQGAAIIDELKYSTIQETCFKVVDNIRHHMNHIEM